MAYATQTRPASAALGTTNHAILGTIVAQSSEATYYPVVNLLDTHRSKRWRSTNVTIAQSVTFDLGSAKSLSLFALVDYNGTTGDIILKGASDSGITASVKTFTFAYPGQSSLAKVMTFYPTADDTGSAMAARQYWQITLPANATGGGEEDDTFHEVGFVWLGTYNDLTAISDVEITVQDDSEVASAYSGARYIDQLRPICKVDLSIDMLALNLTATLRELFALVQQRECILDVHAVSTDIYLYPYGRFYGRIDPGSLTAALRGGQDNSIDITFIEARG